MASNSKTFERKLPQEMQPHTYSIMYEVEESHWWFVGRRRILSSFVERIAGSARPEKARILDVGCGTGANLEMLSEFGQAEGVDVATEALMFCRSRGVTGVKLGEAEKLPYADDSFDLVTGLDVVEHLDDDLAGLLEMHRVLRPGGHALLFVPAFQFLWGVQDEVSNHRRRYTIGELRDVVTSAGFEVERTTYANITFFLPILLGRALMRLTGFRPASENNLTMGWMNGLLGAVFGAEAAFLRHVNFPFGVSAICVAKKRQGSEVSGQL
jgi:SAM-dependent methyltransferase